MRVHRLVALLLLATLPLSSACADWPVRLFGTTLRSASWDRVVSSDPNLITSPMPTFGGLSGSFVETRDGRIGGFAQTSQVVYADLSGDGREEALIPLVQEGAAGVSGLLIYRASDRGPVLAGALGGTLLTFEVTAGILTVYSAHRVGWEEGCCPSGTRVRRVRLEGDRLITLSETITPREQARLPTVARYYRLLGEGNLTEAYALLSPRFRAQQPREAWERAATAATILQLTARTEGDGTLLVELTSQRPDGSEQRTRIRWTLVWSPEVTHWLLDQAETLPAS
ncbi:MAG: hypothetical protein KatS3mg061_2764 [Dehalococcoidia bacterium]|nr:MAG: hypothetical protein KatS3mg061_2764 [Dehalococcoidia bacterium]